MGKKRAAAGLIAAIVMLGACGGTHRDTEGPSGPAGSGGSSATTATPPRRPATPTTSTTVPEYSFDDSVPPPKLVNTGTDYVAILKSLEAYGNWIGAHRPEPSLARNAVAAGSPLLDAYTHDISILKRNHKREVETLDEPSEYRLISATSDAFSMRVVEHIASHHVVDPDGRIVSERRYSSPTTYTYLVVLQSERWHLADAQIVSGETSR